MSNNHLSDSTEESTINIREILLKYFSHWKWFLFSLIIMFVGAKLYLRYSIPQYKTLTTLLIKREESGGMPSEFSALQEIGMFSGSSKDIDDEMEVLKSKTLIQKTVKEGKFNISYVLEGRIKSSESYNDSPVDVNFINPKNDFYKLDTIIKVKVLNRNKFELLNAKNILVGTYNFGQNISSPLLGNYVITKNLENSKQDDFTTIVNISPLKKASNKFKSKLVIGTITKQTNVLEISCIDPVKEKSEDFLNKLVEIYNRDAILDKNLISEKTAKFISERLDIITSELDDVERNVEKYKYNNKITDLPTEAVLYLENSSVAQKEVIANGTQLKVVAIMQDYIARNKNYDIIPANIVPDDNKSAGLIAEYNNLVIERERVLKSSTSENPAVIRVSDKIDFLRNSISQSLKNLKSSLNIKNNDIIRQENIVNGRISKIPKQEREFRGIFRQQQIKEELYLFLFKKREETAITLAATAPISKVVDAAYSIDSPVSPKSNLIYLVALIAGLLIPFSVIYILDLLDTKVKNRQDIESSLSIPFVGDVPHSDDNNNIIQASSRTSTAEAIRIVRTNLEFVLSNTETNKAKTVFLTSTLPKEGKTFIAINLAATFAISGKKVLLIGMDVRNPKLDEYVNLPAKGLTNFLSTKDAIIDDFIVKQDGYDNFCILPAGIIPPNPAELLMGQKVETMFTQLKTQFDYIVVDTAPVSLVTDTLLISKYADAFIYVVRANYLEKAMLKIPQNLYKENKLPNMSILLNDTDTTNGYGYGYGQEVKKAPWYKKIFNFSFFG